MKTKSVVGGVLFLALGCQSADKAPASINAGENSEKFISDVRQLTTVGLRAGEGYFSADGKQMVFQSEREEGNPFYQIYLMDLASGDTSRLVSPGLGKTTCAWIHPSGEKILFASTHLDPKAKKKQDEELARRKSGEKKKYAWDYDPYYDLFAADVDGKNIKRLTKVKGYDAEGSYSPDGNWIAFASNRTAHNTKLTPEERRQLEKDPSYFMDIYIMKADGSAVKRLTTSPGYDGGPFFSPDGKRITWRRFSPDGMTAEVYTMNIDGSDQKQITRLGAMSWAPFYHPSGDYLIFTTSVHGHQNFELYIVDVRGEKTPVRVTELDGFDGLPVFTPDGQSLAWSRRIPGGDSQIYIGKWNDALARASLGH